MISLKLNQKQIQEIKEKYRDGQFRYDIPYTHFQVKLHDAVITAYTSGKVVFAGKNADSYAEKYGSVPTQKGSMTKQRFPMSGSDEVGTGDYFGPVTLAACYLDQKDLQKIPLDEIRDSKQITDEKIIEIAPILMKELRYSLLILSNKQYNHVQKKHNLNAIKALMHNQAYLNLNKKVDLSESLNVVDQFVSEKKYYEYLVGQKHIFQNLVFETKAENNYLAVACAAIIARYAFLHEWLKMEKLYNMKFPKGSGKKVNQVAQDFIDQYGFDELQHVAKIHFKITDDLQ